MGGEGDGEGRHEAYPYGLMGGDSFRGSRLQSVDGMGVSPAEVDGEEEQQDGDKAGEAIIGQP